MSPKRASAKSHPIPTLTSRLNDLGFEGFFIHLLDVKGQFCRQQIVRPRSMQTKGKGWR